MKRAIMSNCQQVRRPIQDLDVGPVTVTSRVVELALGLAPIGVIKRASRLND